MTEGQWGRGDEGRGDDEVTTKHAEHRLMQSALTLKAISLVTTHTHTPQHSPSFKFMPNSTPHTTATGCYLVPYRLTSSDSLLTNHTLRSCISCDIRS